MPSDWIEKQVVIAAPRARVWDAVSDAARFGAWFGVRFDGPFAPGATLTGSITPTEMDPEIARLQAPHAGKRFEFQVGAIEPMRRIAFRWHPFAIDPAVDYGWEPPTTIEFTLEDAPAGTRLTIKESGFDRLPAARQKAAYEANDGGWTMQCRLVKKYCETQPS